MEVLRSGQPGMDAGLAAPGQGWPMAACPRSRTGERAWRALASHRTSGAKPFGSFSAFGKGTRRKGETISGRYRSNGYVHLKKWSATRPPSPASWLLQLSNTGHPAASPFPARSRFRHNQTGNTSGSRLSIKFFNANPNSVSPSITRRRRKNSVSGSS